MVIRNLHMKKLIYTALALLFAVSCVEEIPPVIEDVNLSRCFEPTNVTAVVKNGEYVNFNWDKAKTTEVYILELFTNEALEGDPAFHFELDKSEIPYLAHLEADVTYWFRVRGTAEGKDPSKWFIGEKKLETTAIKSTLEPVLVDRTSTSISMSWTADPEVDHIRIVPPLGEDVDYTRMDLSESEVAFGAAIVEGLKSSTHYSLTLHFKSADRGAVYAWTRPDMTGVVEVADTTALRAALVDAAPKIMLRYREEPYMLLSVKLAGPVALYGEETLEGAKPVFQGDFQADPNVVSSLHFENLEFDGMDYKYGHMVTILKAGTMSEVTALNCDIHGYSKGIFYDNYGLTVPSVVYDHCLIHDFEGNQGDCFDFRKKCAIGSVKFSNSSLYDGMRSFIRIDANPTLESLEISNCTFSNLLYRVDGNTNGLVHVRAKNAAGGDPAIILKKNVFLNMRYGDQGAATKRCTLIGTNSADKLPTEIAKNWYYNCDDSFFSHIVSSAETLGLEKCVAGGGALLSEDPCMDSESSLFYVISTAVTAAQAGDPRWLEPYKEEPEDLTQEVTVPIKTWNLTDPKYFKKAANKDMVRDGIRFYVAANPIEFTPEGFRFTSAPTMAAGCPADGGISIKVDRPGAVVVSTAAQEDQLAMLVVNMNGSVKAGVPVGAQNQMVTFPDIVEGSETMIYLYATSPIVLSGLQWTDDIDPGDSQLATPVLTLSATEFVEGSATPLVVSWDAVPKAGSYELLFIGNTWSTTETSYSIDLSKYAADNYSIGVRALPAETDLVRQPSELAYAEFVIKETLKPVSKTTPTVWDKDYMQRGVNKFGNGTEITKDVVYQNLNLLCGGGKFKFGIDNADTDPKPRLQLGGTGNPGVKTSLQFIAGGAGTLVISARSSGDGERPLGVAIGGSLISSQNAPGKGGEPAELSWEVASGEGDIINIYSTNSGINLYSITWTPSDGGDTPPSPIDDPDAINEAYSADFTNAEKFPAGAFEEAKVIDKVTYCGASGAAMNFDPSGKRVKFNGASTLGEDGIPIKRYASFKITKPGVITHKLISGSSSAVDRKGAVILVTTTADGKKVTTLWNDFTPTSSGAEAMTYTVTAAQLEGITEAAVVYFYAEANINLYALGFMPE